MSIGLLTFVSRVLDHNPVKYYYSNSNCISVKIVKDERQNNNGSDSYLPSLIVTTKLGLRQC